MGKAKIMSKAKGGFRQLLRLAAGPAKKDRGLGGIVIQPYRGHGSSREVFLMGRVFKQSAIGAGLREGTLLRDLLDVARRFLRWGVGNAVVRARLGGAEERTATDRDGYFHVHMRVEALPPSASSWHRVELEFEGAGVGAKTSSAEVFVPPPSGGFGVISDIDDTVMETGVANKALMLWRLFAQKARSRAAFPGVAAFYRGLHRGASGSERNLMLYVSRGPWSIYEVLDAFFQLHKIPVGPVLFLREWGLTLQRPLPRRAEGHKLDLIRRMMAIHSGLPFILIGDSGQRDPEIYAQAVREHPGRVLAVYIRNVTRDPSRRKSIDELADQVVQDGSSLVMASDSFAMASHAAERGFLSSDALTEVLAERAEEDDTEATAPTRRIEGATSRKTQEALDRGDLNDSLSESDDSSSETPPNVVVESERRPPRRSS